MENSAAASLFPWRQLGMLLADEGLLTDTELELALDEQRRTGRLLGQIVVDRGYVSAFSLARVLSAQHGVELQRPDPEPEPAPHLAVVPTTWRPLGRVLVENGLITQTELAEALLQQNGTNGRLGEILIERGAITGSDLAHALSEQHGVELTGELEATLKPAAPTEPVYRVYNVTHSARASSSAAASARARTSSSGRLRHGVRAGPRPRRSRSSGIDGESRRRSGRTARRARPRELARKDLVDTFGFDPTRWNPNR
jgi:hypothetical protein